jgi:hypothetical protein
MSAFALCASNATWAQEVAMGAFVDLAPIDLAPGLWVLEAPGEHP